VWRETANGFVKGDKMAVPVFLVHCLEDEVSIVLKTSGVTSPDHLELVIEGFVKLELAWASL
jgi:hypothetical protein